MLVGFGDFGADAALPSSITGAAIAQLGTQLTTPQQCASQGGQTYCLSKQGHLDSEKTKSYAIGAAVGAVAGAAIVFLLK